MANEFQRGPERKIFRQNFFDLFKSNRSISCMQVWGGGGGAEKGITFASAGKIFKVHFYLVPVSSYLL